jgi:AraC-like DNA-binding protein
LQNLQILWVSRSQITPGAGVKSHIHPYYHMFFVQAGRFRFCAAGRDYDLQPGHTLLVPPNTNHGYKNETDCQGEYLELKFALSETAPDARLLGNNVQHTDSPLVAALFSQIIQEYSDLGKVADDAAAAYLAALLSALSKNKRYDSQPRQFRHVDASGCTELSQKIIHYLEAHYSEDLSLDSLAEALGYHKSYLCVAFKKDTRQTILDCLNTIRIRSAAELIIYSDNTLPQVAELCGFSSVSHFNRVFLKYAGITPGHCRQAYPPDILFGYGPKAKTLSSESERFLYNVLAQKRVTPELETETNREE